MKSKLTQMERFELAYMPEPNSGCWLWTGAMSGNGYGSTVRVTALGVFMSPHRLSWYLHNGPIPDGMQICHKCDTPLCVNPGHLFVGTLTDNMRDKVRKNRQGKCGPRNPAKGESSHNARLTNEQVVNIFHDPRPGQLIATDYGVARTVISGIKNGASWRHITGPLHAQKVAEGKRCRRGHLLAGDNLRILKGGHRRCATCYRESFRMWVSKNSAHRRDYDRKRRKSRHFIAEVFSEIEKTP